MSSKDDPQAAFHLLRMCFTPKINHLLRTVNQTMHVTKDGGYGLNYASDIRETANVASLAAAISRMLQIAIHTRHPMSQNLENSDSDLPVMRTLVHAQNNPKRKTQQPN